ncbi:hypothetical protein [Hymenobacter cavernae]|uniref:DUF4369 domain-containing protein n=1 Tax=Hymenobacter cavernae TaxID=2044852 RepID=A0ABQ1US78_9BACT|nr:hypothetical protein [Hymenobacter cavernae]GGF25852.1 hypothetical protein GCM10011383_41770 [Hymenobacter cavernae]
MWKRWKITVIGLLSLVFSQATQAQFFGYAQQYAVGAVVLTSGTQLRGTVMLYPARGVVQVKKASDSVYTFAAPMVQCVAVEEQQERITADKLVSTLRVFRPYYVLNKSSLQPTWAFFEQISDGPVALLRYQRPSQYVSANMVYSTSVDNFFLALGTNNVLPLRATKKDLLAFFKQKAPQIEQYAKENNLHYTNARELAFIVNYANSLPAPQP